jgi:prepilin signal peptidase PulO-like enzyme (type II secretory pathway)
MAVYLILLGTAAWDARTGIVPDMPLLIGAIIIMAARFYTDWHDALIYAGEAIAAYGIIWAFNEIWYKVQGRDALGMGDAKWTALAIAAFGVIPGMFAWFAGAWVAIAWIAISWAVGQRIRKVYYAPFLFCGLTIGILLVRHIVKLPPPFII